MAARRPKDVSAWLGGNRGTVQSGGGKPTGIVDDIAKGIKDIASPWLPAAPGQNKSVTQAQGLARAAAETLDQAVTGGLVQAGTQGNKALAKQAAINAAALGAGYVAGKAAQKALPLVQAQIGKELGVHLTLTDKLQKIKYSNKYYGTGLGADGKNLKSTYKFSADPYSNYASTAYTRKELQNLADRTIEKYGFREEVYAYITKSKRGRVDPTNFVGDGTRVVKNQKVLEKIKAPKEEELYNALLRNQQSLQQNTQQNTQTTLNTVRGVVGVAAQQTGTKKIKRR